MDLNTISLWKSISQKPSSFPRLTQDLNIDIAIIGGGITGLLTAYQLIQAGKKVAIFEKDNLAENTTGFSTGNLYVAVQPLYQQVKAKFNLDVAKTVMKSRQAAIDFIEHLVLEHQMQCNFHRRPWFVYANDNAKVKMIEREADLFAKAGIAVHDEKSLDLPFAYKKAIRMDNQARINPMQFCLQVAEVLKSKGCQIFENTPIHRYEEKDAQCFLSTGKHTIKSNTVVIATHTPIGVVHKQMLMGPYRSYVVAAKLEGTYPNGNYWDLEKPHHAISTHSDVESNEVNILAVAGRHHKTGQDKHADQNYAALEKFIRNGFKIKEIVYRWSAQHYQAADSLPYIGLLPHHKHIYMASGFFADGLVYGALSGLILSDRILGKTNQWQSVYDSTRFTPLASAPAFIKEGTNVFMQYMKDYPGNSSGHHASDVKNGEAKIIESGGEKIAAYRDPQGKLHAVSAVCTHMKCIVDWNTAEKTWDCPCHGSRFTIEGKVIEGPALKPLAQKELKK